MPRNTVPWEDTLVWRSYGTLLSSAAGSSGMRIEITRNGDPIRLPRILRPYLNEILHAARQAGDYSQRIVLLIDPVTKAAVVRLHGNSHIECEATQCTLEQYVVNYNYRRRSNGELAWSSSTNDHSGLVSPLFWVNEATDIMEELLGQNPAITTLRGEFWVLNSRRTILRSWNGEPLRPT